jgi:hypothetical protein
VLVTLGAFALMLTALLCSVNAQAELDGKELPMNYGVAFTPLWLLNGMFLC